MAKYAVGALAALATIYFAGWSGASAGLVRAPSDDSPGFWVVFAALLAVTALLPAAACVAAARPARVGGRLAMFSAMTWTVTCISVVLADTGDLSASLPLVGLVGIVTTVALQLSVHQQKNRASRSATSTA